MTELKLVTDYLQTIAPFNGLAEDELSALARHVETSYSPANQQILKSSDDPGLVIIRKGAVRLLDDSKRFLDKRSEREFFGHRICFRGDVSEYIAEAEEDSLLWHIPSEVFSELCQQHPVIGDYFSSQLKTRLSAANVIDHAAARVKDLLKNPPVTIEADASVKDAAGLMSEKGVSSVLVMQSGKLAGIVTDKDLRQRVLARGADPAHAISTVMTVDPMTLEADRPADAALLLMMRENYHHLPVVEQGQPIGLVTAGDILRAQSEHPLRLIRDIHKSLSVEALEKLSSRLPGLFERMVILGRDVEQVGRMITHITDAFTVRLIQLAAQQFGQPPMRFAWVVFGSQAREEQTAKTDQDNGLILESKPSEEIKDWFEAFTRFVCTGLDRLGYIFCPGEIMAMNAKWMCSLGRWRRHFDAWIDEPEPKSVMHSSIFFDMRCVYGEQSLVDELSKYAHDRASDNRIFRHFMAANVLTHRPPLGFFRQFVQEDDGSHSEGLNLKHRGIVPIVDLARIRALEGNIQQAGTYRRLEEAARQGTMNEDDAESLRDAYSLINRIRLNHQCEQLSRGEAPGNFVPPEDLSPLMRRNLKAAFMIVVEAQKALAVRYQVG